MEWAILFYISLALCVIFLVLLVHKLRRYFAMRNQPPVILFDKPDIPLAKQIPVVIEFAEVQEVLVAEVIPQKV